MMRQHLLTAGSGSDSDAEVPTDHQQPHHQPQQPGQQQHHPQPNFQQAESVRPRSTLFTNAKTKTTLQRSGAVSPSDVNGSPRSVSHTGTPTPPPPQGSVFSPHRQHPSNPASPVDRARLAQSTAVTAPASTSSPVLPLATGSADVSAPGATAVKSYRCASGGPVRAQARPGAAFSSRGPRSAFAKSSSAELLTAVKEEPKSPVAVTVKEEPHQAPPPSTTAASADLTTTAGDSAERSTATAATPADNVATNAQRSFNADEQSSHGLIHQAVQNLTLSVHSTTAREVNVASMFSANVIALLLKQSSPHRGHFSGSATVSDTSSSLQTALTRAAEMERGVPTSDLAKCLSGFDSDVTGGSVSPWAIVTPQAVLDAFATTLHEGNAKILEMFAVRMQGELAAHKPQQHSRSSPSSNSTDPPNEAMVVLREALSSNTSSGSSSSPLDFWKSPEVVIAMTASVLQAIDSYDVFQLNREESCESGTGGTSKVVSLGEAAHRLTADVSNTGGGEFTIGQNAVSLARVIGEEIARLSAPTPTLALSSSPLSALFALCSAASPGVLNQSWKVLVNLCHGVALLKERLATMDGTLQPPTAPSSSVRDCNSLMADSDQLLALVLSMAAASSSSSTDALPSTTARKRSRDGAAATMPSDGERVMEQPGDWERVLSLATSADFRHANAHPEQTANAEREVHLTTRAAVMTSVVFVAVDALHTALVSFALHRVATIASETADIARGWLCHGTSSTVKHLFGLESSALHTDSSAGASVNLPRTPPSEKELKTLKFYVAHAATIVRQAPELALEIGGTTSGDLTLSPPTTLNADDELPDSSTQRRITAPLFDAAASISITVEHAGRLAFSAVDATTNTTPPNATQNEENDGMTVSDKVSSATTVCGMSIDDETRRAWARVRQELVVGIQPRIEAAVSAACSAVTKASPSRSVGRSVATIHHTSIRTKNAGGPFHSSAHSISTAAMRATVVTGEGKEALFGSALVEDFVTLADHKAKRLDATQRCLAAACDTVADAASPRPSGAMIRGALTTSMSSLVGVKEEISRWERKQNAALSAFFTTCAVARDGVSLSGRGEWISATSSAFASETTRAGSAALCQSPSKRSRESDGKTPMAPGSVSGRGGQEHQGQPDQVQVRSVVAAVDAAVSTSISTLQALLLWLPGMAAAGLPPLPTSVLSSVASPAYPKASSGHTGTPVPTETNVSGCGYDVTMNRQSQWSVACDVESIAPAIRELTRHLPEGFFSSAAPLPVAKALPSEVPTAQRWWRAATAVLVDLDAVFVHAHKMIDADPTRTAFLTIELTALQRKTVSALFAVLLAALQVPDDATLERVVSLWLFWVRFSSQSSQFSSSTSSSSSSLVPAPNVLSAGPVTSIDEAMSTALQQSGAPSEVLQSMVTSSGVSRNVAAASSQASITSWLVAVHGKCKARAERAKARALRKLAKTSASPSTDATADVPTTGAKRAAGAASHYVAARMAASIELILKEAGCFPDASSASNDQDAAPPMKSPCRRDSAQKTTPASTVTSCAEVLQRAVVQADDHAGSIGVVSPSASSPATAPPSPSSLETLRKSVNDFTNAASLVAAPTQCLTAASKGSLASTAMAALASTPSSASPSLNIVTNLISIVGVGRSTKSLFESWSQITSLAKAVPLAAPTTAAAVAWALKQQLLLLPSTFSPSPATGSKSGHESTANLSSAATSMMFEALVDFILSYAHAVLAAAHSLSAVKTPHELSVFCGLIVDFVTELSSLQFVFGHVLSFCLDETEVSRTANERDVKQVMEKLATLQQTITGQAPDSEAATTRGGVQSTVVRRAAGRFVAAMSASHGQMGQPKSSPTTASSLEVDKTKEIRSVCSSAVSNVSALAMSCGQLVEVLGSTSLTQALGSRKATDALTALSKVDSAHCKAHHEIQTKSASPTSQGSQQNTSQQQQQQKDKSFVPMTLVTNTPHVKYAVSLHPQQSPVFVRGRGGNTTTAEASLLQSVSVLTSFVLDPASLVFPAGSCSGLLPSGARSKDTSTQHKTAVFEGLVDTGTVDVSWRCAVPVSESSTLCDGSSKAALDALNRCLSGAFGTDSSASSPGRHGSKDSQVSVHAVAAFFFDSAIGSFNSPLCPVFTARNMPPDASKKSGEEQLIVRSHGSSVAAFNAALFAAMASRAAYPLQQLIPTNPVLANVLVRSVEWQNAADSAPGVSAVASGASTLHLGCGPAPAFSPVTQISAQIASQASALRTALTSMVTSPSSSRGHNPFGGAVSPNRGHTHGNITAIASVLSDTLQSLHAVIAASTAPLRRSDLIEDLQQCLAYARGQHKLFKQISEDQTKSSSPKDVASSSPFLIASARAAALRHSAAKARAAAAAERSNARSLLPGSNTTPSQNRAAKGRVDGLFEIDKLRAQFAPIARNTPGGEVEIESSLSQQHDSRDRMNPNPNVPTAGVGGVSDHQGARRAPNSSRGPDGVRSGSPSLIQKQDTLPPPPPHAGTTTVSTPFVTGAEVVSAATAGVPLPPNHAVMTLQQSIVSVQSVIEALDPRANQNANASPNSNLEHGLALNESDAKAVLAAAQELQQAAREVVRVAKALQPRVAPASEIEVLDD